MIWMTKYIGMEWIARENDCWSFFRRVQLEQFGRFVPEMGHVDALNRLACTRAFEGEGERENWNITSSPVDGDAVLMGRGKHPSHIGVYAGGRVLHCIEHSGVILQDIAELRISGWNLVSFYGHK